MLIGRAGPADAAATAPGAAPAALTSLGAWTRAGGGAFFFLAAMTALRWRSSGSLGQFATFTPSVEAAGVVNNPWAMPSVTGHTVWICRGRKPALDAVWTSLRNYS